MNIIQKQPNSNGSYSQIHKWNENAVPNGYYEITADTTELYNGFIVPTVEDGVVTSFICNTEAWEAWNEWQIANPEVSPQPTAEEQLRADVDFLAVMTGVTL